MVYIILAIITVGILITMENYRQHLKQEFYRMEYKIYQLEAELRDVRLTLAQRNKLTIVPPVDNSWKQ